MVVVLVVVGVELGMGVGWTKRDRLSRVGVRVRGRVRRVSENSQREEGGGCEEWEEHGWQG